MFVARCSARDGFLSRSLSGAIIPVSLNKSERIG